MLLLVIHIEVSHAQNIVYDNAVYVNHIKSVKLTHAGLETSYPIIDLGTRYQGRLELSFDDLEGGYKRYTYKIIHCDKDWFPSLGLNEIEYLEGFNNEEIEEYAYSSNGYSEYTNYRLIIPNDNIRWTLSGNYLLVVTDDDIQVPVITRRFMVTENLVNIGFELIKPRDVRKFDTHQEIKMTVSYKNFKINQPRIELYATVLQNGNWNSAKTNLTATYERGESIIFDQYDYISFPALKEFRNFDIRPLGYTTEFVTSIDQDETETTVLIDLNKKRTTRNFVHELDANGFFIIDNDRYPDPHVSSEYCKVIFNLQSAYKYDEELYIIGAFSDWQAKEEYRLEYDALKNLYLGQAYFKQGYYDYMFALQNENGLLDVEAVEGSWFETENDYQILIYFREFGSFYDRIISVKNFNSNPRN
jgi:hypothetical protein